MALVLTHNSFSVVKESIMPSSIALGSFAHDNRIFWRVRREKEGEAIVKLRETGYAALLAKGKTAGDTVWLLEKIRKFLGN